ncbi:hypothetical protein [Neoaquamicrobium sediminum]|uniref:hypothetical protein n=1 Tax=Neoaquamicrobium sediminum TaxID=1849104 RepID=UPI003BAD6EB5
MGSSPIHADLNKPTSLISPRPPLPQASPEEVFLAWLIALPEGEDVAVAARKQIRRLDEATTVSPPLRRLRALLAEAAGTPD